MNSVFHYRPSRLRREWNRIIETEGAKFGLLGCRSFLENKIVNDIFYEGLFKGLPCIVKCSSRAPNSIANEYEMLRRVHAAEPSVFPEPFALWTAPDGRMAFVAMEKVGGGTPSDPAADILCIAETLRDTGIVHRDIRPENIICGADGHLKLIDFQFAVDRDCPKSDLFLAHNPKYHFVSLGGNKNLGIGVWTDAPALAGMIDKLSKYEVSKSARLRIIEMQPQLTVRIAPTKLDVLRLKIYRLRLLLQGVFHRFLGMRDRTAWRRDKLGQLFRSGRCI